MKRMTRGVVGLALSVGGLVLLAGAAHAQSLADVARNEQARRKEIKQPTKVYTNDDVRNVKPISTMGQSASAGKAEDVAKSGAGVGDVVTDAPANGERADGDAAAAPPASGEPGAAVARPGTAGAAVGGGDEAQWRARMTAAREQLSRARIQLDAMQTRSTQLALGAATQGEASPVGRLRQDAQQEATKLREDVQRYEQALSDLENQAHQAGVPAGWLR